MLLVVSRAGDSHTGVVLGKLAQMGLPAELLDLSSFPQHASIWLSRGARKAPEHGIEWVDGRRLSLDAIKVIWWRRPQSFQLHDEIRDPGYAAFTLAEVHEAFAGLWPSLDTFWINHPAKDLEAGRKAWQLSLAAELGFEIPDTLITSDPRRARAFIELRGPENTVYKSFSATAVHWRETRVLRSEELGLLDNVRFAPVIFQEYIPAEVDLRITIVGDQLFPAAIYSQQTSYAQDFRMDMFSARMEACTLPHDIEEKLRRLMKRLGLTFGAVDMRRTPEGRHVFLEINPAGQWLFVEDRTGQRITDALCSLMAAHANRPPARPKGRR
jgi:hypothetical protein